MCGRRQTHGHRVNLTLAHSGGTVINKHKYLLQVYSGRLPALRLALPGVFVDRFNTN